MASQAGLVDYELHTLGWKSFQDLCSSITAEILGQTTQIFCDTNDGGRDGAFRGVWHPTVGETYRGTFTVQCKFTAKHRHILRINDLNDELEKARRLASKGLADNYILMTNACLTGNTNEKISTEFKRIPGITNCIVYGSEWISQKIQESKRLRTLVPRVYGIGDLSQILDERAYSHAREILSSMGDDLSKFVITKSFVDSHNALYRHGFVLLLGEPAAGKSTIAAALAVGAIDAGGYSTVKVRSADDFVAHYNPDEPKQFFWIDDAFGATQLDWPSVSAWNRALPHLRAAIGKGAIILFTSRDYVYRAAQQHLKESALPIMREAQVVIQVDELTKDEREKILYNHIRLGSQTQEFRRRIKPWLPIVAANPMFAPEIARRLGDPIFTKKLAISENGLKTFVENPLQWLAEIITTLDDESRSALALIFIAGGVLPSPLDLETGAKQALEMLGGTVSGVKKALASLNDSLVICPIFDGKYIWRFKHPTIRDAFAEIVAENRELLDIYLAGTPIDRLLNEVSCGNVGIRGVKVIVTQDRYDMLIERLDRIDQSSRTDRNLLLTFLAHRADQSFLSAYVDRYPAFIGSLSVYSYLNAVPDFALMVRLHEYGLLSEAERMETVEIIRQLATETPDAGFLDARYRTFFLRDEIDSILAVICNELLPNLDSTISDWEWNYSRTEENPENYFDELIYALQEYKDALATNQEAVVLLEEALAGINFMIERLQNEKEPDRDDDDLYDGRRPTATLDIHRSIFDDIDT